MIHSTSREYFDSPMRFDCSLGITPIHSRPMIGHRWWLQALRTVIGPMIMSSFKREAFGNSVTFGMGTNRPRKISFTYILATRLAVSRVLWSCSRSMTRLSSKSVISDATSFVSSSISPGSMNAEMLSLA